jgi:hypothetical protein
MVAIDIVEVEVDRQVPEILDDEIVDHDHQEIGIEHIVNVINNDLNVLINVILDHVHVLHHLKHLEIK